MTTPHRLIVALKAFFAEEDWSYTQHEDLSILKLGFTGKNGNWNCFARVRELDDQFVFYSMCPMTVPEKKRLAVAEFLTRANYGLVVGNFELDLDDGEVRYKSSFDAAGSDLTANLIKNVVYANVLTMDKYFPGILAVLAGNVDPRQAIDDVESDDRQDLSKS